MIKIMKPFKVLSADNKTAVQNKNLTGETASAKEALKNTRQDKNAATMLTPDKACAQKACLPNNKSRQTHPLTSALKKVKIRCLPGVLKNKEPGVKQGRHPNLAMKEGARSNPGLKQTHGEWMKTFFHLKCDMTLFNTIPPRQVYPENLPSDDVDAALFLMKQSYSDGVK